MAQRFKNILGTVERADRTGSTSVSLKLLVGPIVKFISYISSFPKNTAIRRISAWELFLNMIKMMIKIFLNKKSTTLISAKRFQILNITKMSSLEASLTLRLETSLLRTSNRYVVTIDNPPSAVLRSSV